ncbi:DNA-methyltransferase [Levilinea saccharolytica]|uniref:DNA-methyltransferase n=1 Tax=Levilinea saccharolytica TaxID=229921 RepID=UPI0009467E26|nr:site-specific DNA-methyltransferase [Levilinea saccharolytica]GAP17016.1 DNA modification methylase [Levilinea saccharolytica]
MSLPLFHSTKPIDSHFKINSDIVLFEGDVNRLLTEIPSNSIQLIITSPPYNLGKDYESRVEIGHYLDQQASIIANLYRVLKDEGSLCWQVGNFVQDGEVFPLDILYYGIFKNLGLKLRNRIIWRFGHGLHASKRFSGRYETILWFTKSDRYTFNLDQVRIPSKYPGKRHFKGSKKGELSGNPLGKNPSDVWEIILQDWEKEVWDIPNVKANHPEKTDHPCQYPIELVERCVLALTNEGDWVLDPFAGVGSTLLAAIKNNRKAVGSDKEKEYVDLARQRILSLFNGTLGYRQLGTPVYQPTGKEKVSRIPDEWGESYGQQKMLEHKGEYDE